MSLIRPELRMLVASPNRSLKASRCPRCVALLSPSARLFSGFVTFIWGTDMNMQVSSFRNHSPTRSSSLRLVKWLSCHVESYKKLEKRNDILWKFTRNLPVAGANSSLFASQDRRLSVNRYRLHKHFFEELPRLFPDLKSGAATRRAAHLPKTLELATRISLEGSL